MPYHNIKRGKYDNELFVTISYKDRRITKPLILGLERFFQHWDELKEFEKENSAKMRVKK